MIGGSYPAGIGENIMARRKPLSYVVAEGLTERIRSGQLRPGDQLPTEAELCTEYEVSRTVIREAVARLRSEGLVIPEQGRGMFVSEAPPPRTFSIDEEALKTLPETIGLLELRLSVEVEAAGLSAERRTAAEALGIRELMEQIDERHPDPSAVEIHYDYDFHLAIAESSRNAFMHGFLSYLRPLIVPRFQLGHVVIPELKDAYYARIHSEHAAIVHAIESQQADQARKAMRRHLSNSLERIRAIALASGIHVSDESETANSLQRFEKLLRPISAG
jgi:GntR family transcriptional repressor for pyruvate dehydrogenase complex